MAVYNVWRDALIHVINNILLIVFYYRNRLIDYRSITEQAASYEKHGQAWRGAFLPIHVVFMTIVFMEGTNTTGLLGQLRI